MNQSLGEPQRERERERESMELTLLGVGELLLINRVLESDAAEARVGLKEALLTLIRKGRAIHHDRWSARGSPRPLPA
jgi:hypothetical protein